MSLALEKVVELLIKYGGVPSKEARLILEATGQPGSGAGSTVQGDGSSASGAGSSAYGPGADASGDNSAAHGPNATAGTSDDATAVGPSAIASGTGASAYGTGATASGPSSFAAAKDASASGNESVAVGQDTDIQGGLGVGFGKRAFVSSAATAGTALSADADVTHLDAGAWGRNSASTEDRVFTFGQVNGSSPNQRSVEVSDELIVHGGTDQNQRLVVKVKFLTVSGLSGATHTAAGFIPAGAILLGTPTARTASTITGATSAHIGDGTDPDRWGVLGTTLGSTTDVTDATTGQSSPMVFFPAAQDVVFTAVGGGASFTAGAVGLTIYYIEIFPAAP